MVVKARFQDEESYFLINVEPFADDRGEFGRRMFRYFARLWEKYNLPVYPILVLSFKYPLKRQSSNFQISLPDLEVINFQYRVVQLNQMNWRDFVDRPNPVASALMSKMKIAKKDRVKVKAQCLRLLVSLSLNPAKMQMISGFVDTYLDLSPLEEIEFEEEIRKFSQPIQEGVMQITTSWMRQGLEQGIAQGLEQGIEQGIAQGLERGLERGIEQGIAQGLEQGIEREKVLIIRLLKRKFGDEGINVDLEARIMALKIDVIERLGEEILDFSTVEDLVKWLKKLKPSK
jgi:flagellar biosynthesis/type III secretory pathway protein FliH